MPNPRNSEEHNSARRPAGRYAVRSVTRVLDILDLLGSQSQGATLGEVAAAVEVPKATAFRYLSILQERGYVERNSEGGRFTLSYGFFLRNPAHALATRVHPFLEEVRVRFDETANFGVLDHGRVLYVEILESTHAMRLGASAGDRDPIHSTALGKAIAAQLSDDAVRHILVTEGMPHRTPTTITDPEEYLRQVAIVRKRGWAIDDGENDVGARCVAACLRGLGVPAALSIGAPSVRLDLESVDAVAAGLLSVAARLADQQQHRDVGVAEAAVRTPGAPEVVSMISDEGVELNSLETWRAV